VSERILKIRKSPTGLDPTFFHGLIIRAEFRIGVAESRKTFKAWSAAVSVPQNHERYGLLLDQKQNPASQRLRGFE
jgi:hypothetical protein